MPENKIYYISPKIFTLPRLKILKLNKNRISGLYLPENYKPKSDLKIYLMENLIKNQDEPDGMLGKRSLRKIFGRKIFFTYQEEVDEYHRGILKFIAELVILILFITLGITAIKKYILNEAYE